MNKILLLLISFLLMQNLLIFCMEDIAQTSNVNQINFTEICEFVLTSSGLDQIAFDFTPHETYRALKIFFHRKKIMNSTNAENYGRAIDRGEKSSVFCDVNEFYNKLIDFFNTNKIEFDSKDEIGFSRENLNQLAFVKLFHLFELLKN